MLKPKSILLDFVAPRARGLTALWLTLLWLAHSQLSTLTAQPVATNRVLELDGKGSYVQLPPGVSKN